MPQSAHKSTKEELASDHPTEELRILAQELAERMEALSGSACDSRRWSEYVAIAHDLARFLGDPGAQSARSIPSLRQRQDFGKLLRDKRDAAAMSRVQLARKAQLSDATIKFAETARHPPSRATLLRLIAVTELGLSWDDVPGVALRASPPEVASRASEPAAEELNCYITPSSDPVQMVMDLGRFLNGAGGHVEQTNAYLDHQSAAAYLAMCQQSAVTVAMRQSMPMTKVAELIVKETGSAGLEVVALGAGDAQLEARLSQYIAARQARPDLRLCLFDVSQPLLSAGFKHATDALTEVPGVSVWALQGNFHHLPIYTQIHHSPRAAHRRHVYCMLGNTLANLDNEPRFFEHSLIGGVPGDLLLLDVQQAYGATEAEIRAEDPALSAPVPKALSTWLAGPIYRHCKDVVEVEFSSALDTQCSLPGSYALHAMATVKATGRPDRKFSMLRVKRYDIEKLALCLARLGWSQLAALPCGNSKDRPSVVMVFRRQPG